MYLDLIKRILNSNSSSNVIEVRDYKVSELLPVNFIESELSLDKQVARDDAWRYIQPKLDESSENIQVNILFDAKVAISDTLRIGSNTNIEFVKGCGIVMMNNVGKSILKNRNHKPYYNDNIIDSNINIKGFGIINGNAKNIPRGTSGQGMAAGMAWHGVKNLTIDGIRIYNHKVYAQIATNVVNGVLKNFVTDIGNDYQSDNMDGVHWDGWCVNCRFENGVVKSNDDAYCCNADDTYSQWQNIAINKGYLDDFYNINFNGPARDIHVTNCVINNKDTAHGFGVRILSTSSRVDNIYIKNLSGYARDYALLIDTYAWYGIMDTPGNGNVGNVFVDDFSVQVGYSSMNNPIPKGQISLTCSISNLIANGVLPNTASNIPTIHKSARDKNNNLMNYGNVIINGINY